MAENKEAMDEELKEADTKAVEDSEDNREDACMNSEESTKIDGDDGDDADGCEDETCEDENSEKTKPEKSSKFLKKDKKDKKDELIEELNDKHKRLMAEFDNFRKRTDKEKSSMYEIGAKDIIEKILPVVDNFERGLKTLSEEEARTPFADGMDKVYKQLVKMLEDAGVSQIDAVGKEFDPNLHNAVMHVDDESLGENIVAEEFQKGYTYRDSVVRHSMVKVAN